MVNDVRWPNEMSGYILVARGTKLVADCSVVISHSEQAWVVAKVCLFGCAARLKPNTNLRPLLQPGAPLMLVPSGWRTFLHCLHF